MHFGIISDTHGILPKSVINHFKNVDYIFHAGDVGKLNIIEELHHIAPVIAVYGNIDNGETKKELPAQKILNFNDFTICLVHDIGSINNFKYELFKKNFEVDLVIYGHTHNPHFEIYKKTIFLNPGSISYPREHKSGTVVVAQLEDKKFSHQFISL
jgi:putative phosphoesterase